MLQFEQQVHIYFVKLSIYYCLIFRYNNNKVSHKNLKPYFNIQLKITSLKV